MTPSNAFDVVYIVAAVPLLVWMCYDMARERRHGRDVRALFDRVKARGGEWSAEDVAEMDRLYPTEKQ